ncbi:MAG: nucleotide kinase [Candidatus Hecatellales archaeon B24]|nr:MAG: nucleotide kinase [Candidatus Hecatellales archaeon B24]
MEEGLTLGFDKRRKCHIADLEGLEKFLVEKFSEVKGFIAFEAPFTVRLKRPLTPKAIFVLRCEPRELAKRLKDKGYSPRKILENVWAEILDYPLQEALATYNPKKVHELNMSFKKTGKAVEEAVEILKKRRLPSHGRINWLKALEEEGLLEKISASPARTALKLLLA